uniref:Uncharacterized protein n=1 Tax=Meloidogyne enterolobii TaxID=390850 RepID=A0A6V7WXQ0_MELEN|nr:unnamed protein product [Meloidogyne enterolobii]
MKTGLSKLFELQPDPYDNTQSKFLRICLVCLFNFIELCLSQFLRESQRIL